ncbi:MAG: hypothetical protein HQL29_03180 [Candidatus Omnitrophica bacterium]|nr:hypothetical protein [Candidatus Omnitrophota bacterium]
MKKYFRIIVYLLVFFIFVIMVSIQRKTIDKKRNADVVTIMSLWKGNGKPVRTIKAAGENVTKEQKLTLVREEGNVYSGYVTLGVKKKIFPQQEVYPDNEGLVKCGSVKGIDENINMQTGLFKVCVTMDKEVENKDRVVVRIRNISKDKVFIVPNDIIEIEDGKAYIWKVVDGKAVKNEIKVGARYGNKAVIDEGVNENDVLIVEGEKLIDSSSKVMEL